MQRTLTLPRDPVPTPEAMLEAGAALAAQLGPGDVLALCGDLGAGKTTLVRGLATALGVAPEAVQSPTFALVHLYRGDAFDIVHADLYRIEDAAEAEEAGLLEQLEDPERLAVVEWPEVAAARMPRHTVWLRVEMAGSGRRLVQLPGPPLAGSTRLGPAANGSVR